MRPNASRCSAHRVSTGFTLLEVLVAMAIISLGLIGVFSSLGQMLSATSLLRDKTLATWIATDRITELRVNGEYPDAGERKDSVDMVGVEWAYRIKVSAIPDLDMRRLDVSVSFADDPDNVIATVIGFLEPAQAPSQGQPGSPTGAAGGDNTNGRRFGEGWEPIPGENLNQDSE